MTEMTKMLTLVMMLQVAGSSANVLTYDYLRMCDESLKYLVLLRLPPMKLSDSQLK